MEHCVTWLIQMRDTPHWNGTPCDMTHSNALHASFKWRYVAEIQSWEQVTWLIQIIDTPHFNWIQCDMTSSYTGWWRPIVFLKVQVIFRKRATNYRAFFRKRPVKIRHPMTVRHPVWVTWRFEMRDTPHLNGIQRGMTHSYISDVTHSNAWHALFKRRCVAEIWFWEQAFHLNEACSEFEWVMPNIYEWVTSRIYELVVCLIIIIGVSRIWMSHVTKTWMSDVAYIWIGKVVRCLIITI